MSLHHFNTFILNPVNTNANGIFRILIKQLTMLKIKSIQFIEKIKSFSPLHIPFSVLCSAKHLLKVLFCFVFLFWITTLSKTIDTGASHHYSLCDNFNEKFVPFVMFMETQKCLICHRKKEERAVEMRLWREWWGSFFLSGVTNHIALNG